MMRINHKISDYKFCVDQHIRSSAIVIRMLHLRFVMLIIIIWKI